ncbi:MAG: hypothetical protein V4567_14305, partial [Pseudomonadota bacterium]
MKNIISSPKDLVVPESKHPKSRRLERRGAAFVISALIEMLAAIEFDDQAVLQTNEIENVARHPVLAAKLHAELCIAQVMPKQRFCIGLR